MEHLDNQLHIQLINIHDLKQHIKAHDKKLHVEMHNADGKISDESLADHENLYDDYQSLEHKLQDLKQEFEYFAGRTS